MSKESRKFHVPDELANLYDFANTLDLRHFVHHGVQHRQAEDLRSSAALGEWMKERGLLERSGVPSQRTFDHALRLRDAIRDYLKCDPAERRRKGATIESLNKAMEPFPLRVAGFGKGGMKLLAVEANAPSGLSAIVAELYDGASNGTLDRLKMCAAEEWQRVFFDRSKRGSRRWCRRELCGNRERPRAYRERQRKDAESEE